ncbi:MAG: hypothetical protein K0S74_370 [Chlamydiales bacterium]|jgi:hypothetical protein|nr:hypothetical protein [Chlamydiales bacterium]
MTINSNNLHIDISANVSQTTTQSAASTPANGGFWTQDQIKATMTEKHGNLVKAGDTDIQLYDLTPEKDLHKRNISRQFYVFVKVGETAGSDRQPLYECRTINQLPAEKSLWGGSGAVTLKEQALLANKVYKIAQRIQEDFYFGYTDNVQVQQQRISDASERLNELKVLKFSAKETTRYLGIFQTIHPENIKIKYSGNFSSQPGSGSIDKSLNQQHKNLVTGKIEATLEKLENKVAFFYLLQLLEKNTNNIGDKIYENIENQESLNKEIEELRKKLTEAKHRSDEEEKKQLEDAIQDKELKLKQLQDGIDETVKDFKENVIDHLTLDNYVLDKKTFMGDTKKLSDKINYLQSNQSFNDLANSLTIQLTQKFNDRHDIPQLFDNRKLVIDACYQNKNLLAKDEEESFAFLKSVIDSQGFSGAIKRATQPFKELVNAIKKEQGKKVEQGSIIIQKTSLSRLEHNSASVTPIADEWREGYDQKYNRAVFENIQSFYADSFTQSILQNPQKTIRNAPGNSVQPTPNPAPVSTNPPISPPNGQDLQNEEDKENEINFVEYEQPVISDNISTLTEEKNISSSNDTLHKDLSPKPKKGEFKTSGDIVFDFGKSESKQVKSSEEPLSPSPEVIRKKEGEPSIKSTIEDTPPPPPPETSLKNEILSAKRKLKKADISEAQSKNTQPPPAPNPRKDLMKEIQNGVELRKPDQVKPLAPLKDMPGNKGGDLSSALSEALNLRRGQIKDEEEDSEANNSDWQDK